MVEIGACLLAFFWCMAAARGFAKQSAFKDYDVDISRTSEDSDFFAGCAYEESGDPAAFYFFNDVEETQAATKPKPRPRPRPRPKPKPQPKPKPPQVKDHSLYEDCVDSLVSLGYNKTEARKITKSILSPNIISINEFLAEVFKRK
mgnify:FL=1|jgi:hypothetical protein